jgi:iron(III) transport system ATP-binding protein
MSASASREVEPYLRIAGLTKKFGAFTALADINLDVYPGELLCFLGPSGCGKTTLLRCIAGLDVQTRGRVIQAGKDISTLPPTERDFGIVFQTYALFPNLTVYKNIAYGLENRKLKKADIEKRVNELLKLMGIPAEVNKYPAQLSGGQQQRVALARALATWPGLLLLDEPLSALDAKVRAYLRYEIRRLQRQLGVTTIMVTHDQEEALTMGDRIVVMDQGVIVQIGTPVELYRKPATPFVAHFLGTMNSLPGVVVDATRVRVGDVELKLADALDGLGQGTPVTVCVRPEDLTPQRDGPRDGNSVSARVSDLEFLGAFYRATLSVKGIEDQRVTADIRPNVVQEQDIREGADLILVFPEDCMRIFAGQGES